MGSMVKIKSFIVFNLALMALCYGLFNLPVQADEEVRYVAIGDSYTIGTGVAPKDGWTFLLVDRLNADGIKMSLVANPSRNGWTTVEAQRWELPVLHKSNAGFVTVMIGVNDWVQNSTDERFRENFSTLLHDILWEVKDSKKVLVVNIPDFSVTPRGAAFASGRDAARGVAKFNMIIAEEAQKRGIEVVDIYTVSQKMGSDPSLVARDGLHPSEKGQALFAAQIYPAVKALLK